MNSKGSDYYHRWRSQVYDREQWKGLREEKGKAESRKFKKGYTLGDWSLIEISDHIRYPDFL